MTICHQKIGDFSGAEYHFNEKTLKNVNTRTGSSIELKNI